MASSINASTTAGLVNTADTSGVLNIQTAGVTAISIDASQAVSFTNSPTVTGGTANGVAYLNGSKVLTTGSALTFSGSALAVTGSISSTGGFTSNTTITAQLDGSDSAGAGPGFNLFNTAFSRGWRTQLSASNNKVDYYFNGSAYVAATTIDTSGNLLVGGTTAGSTSPGIGLTPNGGGSGNGLIYCTGTATTSAASTYFMYSSGAAAYRFYVDFGGTIHATSTSISAISDASLKTNIKDLETGLTEVMALKPRRFDWINGDATNVAGFIAQEVEQVLPELVIDSLYSNDENGNEIKKKNLKMGDILPTLVKAIQEQQALITQLQADVAALKGA